jgi:hypothetical protein
MKKLLLILLCVPLIGFGQKVELLNNSPLIMSKPYYPEDNSSSELIVSTDTVLFGDWPNYTLNAIDWVYNTKNELWLEVECWDLSTAECCGCSATKRKQGWIIKKDVFAPSLFSEILMPLTVEMIDNIGILEVIDKKTHKVDFLDWGWYIKGYGGVLFIDGYVNIDGKLRKLDHHSFSRYPNKNNLIFNPFDIYKSDNIELKIFDNRKSDIGSLYTEGIEYIEIHYEGVIERIIILETEREYEEL